jgi:hypothetical protein
MGCEHNHGAKIDQLFHLNFGQFIQGTAVGVVIELFYSDVYAVEE